MPIEKPSFVSGMPDKEYHADPTPILDGYKHSSSLSSSMASDILTLGCERAMLRSRRLNPSYKEKKSSSMDSGKIIHEFILQDKIGFEIAPFKDFRTSAAKEFKDTAEARGVIVLNQDNGNEMMNNMRCMKSRLIGEMSAHEEFPGLFQNIDPEVSAFSFDGEIWNRARFDMLDSNFPDVIFDYKTTGLEFPSWERGLWNDEHFVQEIHYKKVYKEITGRDARFVYVVQQDFEPYDFILVELDRSHEEETYNRYKYARNKFIRCLKSGVWEGAYKGVRHSYPPTYLMQKWEIEEVEDKAISK